MGLTFTKQVFDLIGKALFWTLGKRVEWEIAEEQ